jgi:hypothetical protein
MPAGKPYTDKVTGGVSASIKISAMGQTLNAPIAQPARQYYRVKRTLGKERQSLIQFMLLERLGHHLPAYHWRPLSDCTRGVHR